MEELPSSWKTRCRLNMPGKRFSGSVNLMVGREDLSEERLEALKQLLRQHQGSGSFYLHLNLRKDRRTIIRPRQMSVVPSERLISGDREVDRGAGLGFG